MITVSFHNGNVSGDLVRAQKAVFEHFGYKDHLQIHTDLPHGMAIDEWLNTRHWDHVAIFDIDCVPLSGEIFEILESRKDTEGLYGIAQSANHLASQEYVGPPFISFNRQTWEKMGRASFRETQFEDVGGYFTRVATMEGIEKVMLMPSHCEEPKWKLPDGTPFGLGTTYEGQIYHAFESRFQHGSTSRFIEKCKEIIGR